MIKEVMVYLIFTILCLFIATHVKAQDLDTQLPSANRDIYMRGAINQAIAFKIGEEIKALNASGTGEITLHITSPGGEVYAGLQIYDYMMESKAPIRTSCEGTCMSMAAYILSSGTTRQSSAHATIMFHQVGTSAQGKINEIIMDLLETQRLQNTLNDILSKRSGMSISDLNKMEAYDHFMSPQECKNLNLLDEIK